MALGKKDIHAKIVAGEYVPRFDYLANCTVEALNERNLRYHNTRGPDPRRFVLPCGVPARKYGRGCITYLDGLAFWGTIKAVDKTVANWLKLSDEAKRLVKLLDDEE